MAAVSPAGPPPMIRQSRIGSSMRSPMDCDSGGSAMTFRASVLTLYPDMFPGRSARAWRARRWRRASGALDATNIRDFATDKHRSVDDTPAGRRGGDGASAGCACCGARQRRRRTADARADAARSPVDAGASPRAGGGRGRHPAVRPFRGIRRADLRGAARSKRCRSATMSCPAESLARWSSSMLACGCFPG